MILPLAVSEFASWCASHRIGLFNLITVPFTLQFLLSLVLLDLIICWQHFTFHRHPLLWRLHEVHHSDQDIDVSSAGRFHFLEILLSMLIKFAAIALLSVPVIAVIVFEITLNGMALIVLNPNLRIRKCN